MVKAIVLSLAFLLLPISSALAVYTTDFKILEQKDIAKLNDQQLVDTYMDALVEVEARRDFFNRFGLVGKEIDDYRAVMKYRLQLLLEIHGRNLDVPQFERY